jgi:hypothetical protein
MNRLPVVILVACATLALQGCAAVGAGIGAAFPKYDRVYPPYQASLPQGTPVRLTLSPEAAGPESEPIDGEFVGTSGGKLTLQTTNRDRAFPEGDIAELKRRSGSHWLEGLVFGAVVDVTVAVIIVLAVSSKSTHDTTGTLAPNNINAN